MKNLRSGGFLISKIHQISKRIFTKLLSKHSIELNSAQGRIMFVLWKKDKIPIQELSKKTSLTKTTLTSMLDRLETMGYIKRVHSSTDRREVLVELTEKDRMLHEKYLQISREMTNLTYQGFSSDEIDKYENFLERILENLVKFENEIK